MPWNADGLDEAAMERAGDGQAALEVYLSEYAVDPPLQKYVYDHRLQQLPFIIFGASILCMS